jgi:transposase
MYYSGIDLHKDNCFITTINDSGAIVRQERLRNEPELILAYFIALGGPHTTVVESTTGWYWLSDLLETHGIELVMAHAKYLKAIAYAKVKTDKVDSHTLALLLRMDFIPHAHKIHRELRDLRDVMRARLRFVGRRTCCFIHIHSIGRKFNCDHLINVDTASVPDLLPEPYKLQIRLLYHQIALLDEQILTLEKSLHPLLIPNDDVQRLLWVPGLGIERFTSDKHFVSYCRLVPGAKNSNRTVRHKSGNKDGNKYLKIAFSDAAVRALQYYPEYRSLYQKIRRRANEPIARTVVAKELARIVYYILTHKTDYKGLKGQPISRQKSLQWPRLASPNA